MTKKSLATKRKRGLINPVGQKWIILWKDGARKGSVGLTKKNLDELKRQFHLQLIQTDYTGTQHYNVLGVKKAGKKAKLTKNRCNPKKYDPKYLGMTKKQYYQAVKMGHDPYKMASIKKSDPEMFKRMLRMDIISKKHPKRKLKRNPVHKPVVIYDKLLGIEARKSHGKFAGENFKHDFKSKTDAMVLGNPDGSLTIRSSKGKRLWKNFKY